MTDKEYEKDIGAIWKMDGKKGKYLSMSIEIDGKKLSFVAFPNQKRKDEHPDFRIFPSYPKGDPKEPYKKPVYKRPIRKDVFDF